MKLKLYFLSLLCSTTFFAQQNLVETKIDKKINKIGAQFNLTLKTTVDTLSNEVEKSKGYIARAEGASQGALTSSTTDPFALGN